MMVFENTLRYSTFADRSQVENRIESYETLMVPSHLMIGGKNAIPPLIHKLYQAGEIEYYVDPAITEFHRGRSFTEAGEIKAWHQKLINELGQPLKEWMNSHNNLKIDELDEEQKEGIAESVCELQESFVSKAVEEQMGKYESALVEDIHPKAVIPWYSKMGDFSDISSNAEIINITADCTSLPVKPCLHVEKDFIRNERARKEICKMVDNSGVEEVFVWIEDFNKVDTTVGEYIAAIRLTIDLMDTGVKPHAMFGDFFTNILTLFGMRGIGFGTYHSEDKAVKLESGGGGNLERYYFDPVKEFLPIDVAAKLGKRFGADVPQHSGLRNWDKLYKLGKDHDFLKNHFIRTKHEHRKYVFADGNGLPTIIQDLLDAHELYQTGLEDIETTSKSAHHLEKWANALRLYRERFPDESEEALSQVRENIANQSVG